VDASERISNPNEKQDTPGLSKDTGEFCFFFTLILDPQHPPKKTKRTALKRRKSVRHPNPNLP
jgi:hypothetical protein